MAWVIVTVDKNIITIIIKTHISRYIFQNNKSLSSFEPVTSSLVQEGRPSLSGEVLNNVAHQNNIVLKFICLSSSSPQQRVLLTSLYRSMSVKWCIPLPPFPHPPFPHFPFHPVFPHSSFLQSSSSVLSSATCSPHLTLRINECQVMHSPSSLPSPSLPSIPLPSCIPSFILPPILFLCPLLSNVYPSPWTSWEPSILTSFLLFYWLYLLILMC